MITKTTVRLRPGKYTGANRGVIYVDKYMIGQQVVVLSKGHWGLIVQQLRRYERRICRLRKAIG